MLDYTTVLVFGNVNDRVIETAGGTKDSKLVEVGYYNGDGKSKAIINISTATGCHVGCNFCELREGGRQLGVEEMWDQVAFMLTTAGTVDGYASTQQPLKINFAKTGDPAVNPHMIEAMERMAVSIPGVSFKYSTVLPAIPKLLERIRSIASFAARYSAGSTQLTVSLISTNEEHRRRSTKSRIAPLGLVREAIDVWREHNPSGRTPNCSLLIGADTPCKPQELVGVLPPELIRLRLRPIIPTQHSSESGILPVSQEKVRQILDAFRRYGYDISDAGIPTATEERYGLASNVTRYRLIRGSHPRGMIYVPV